MSLLTASLVVTSPTCMFAGCNEDQSPSLNTFYEQVDSLYDKTTLTSIVYFEKKKKYREIYKQIAQSRWFNSTYVNKSVGDYIKLES